MDVNVKDYVIEVKNTIEEAKERKNQREMLQNI